MTKRTDDEFTPPEVYQPVLDALGTTSFVTDPATHIQATVPAAYRYTIADDGLSRPWLGLVWCNPPYSKPNPWILRCAEQRSVMLISADTSTKIWRDVIWPRASIICFWYGRIRFTSPHNEGRTTSAKRPSALVFFNLHPDPACDGMRDLAERGRLVFP